MPPGTAGGSAPSGFPSENQIPDFGKPLPATVAPGPAGGSDFGNAGGFVTTPQGGYQQAGGGSDDEQRVQRLEQSAFGSTYPEHEIEDRVDHLEKEVFGNKSDGDISDRLSKLEAKLSGGSGAFGGGQGANNGTSGGTNLAGSVTPYPAPKMVPAKKQNKQSENKKVAKTENGQNEPPVDSGGGPDGRPESKQAPPSDKRGGKKEDRLAALASQLGADYFTTVRRFPNDTVARWTNLPVRVHLPQGSPDSWQKALESGVTKWNDYLKVEIVPASQPADVEVSWVNHLVPQYLGVTRLQIQNGNMQSQIFMLRPTYYLPEIPEKTLQSAFLHELGHALGIFGHSDSPEDLMYGSEIAPGGKGKPSKIKFAPISTRDSNTLKKIYEAPSLPPGYSLPQPLEWGSTRP